MSGAGIGPTVGRAFAAALVCLACAPSWGAAVRLDAFVQPADRASDTETIRYTIRVEGAEMGDLAAPRLPALENLRVMSGPSTQSQFSWVNGQVSASSSFTWLLLAEGPGPAAIPPVPVRVGSTTYRTEPVRLQIVKGQTGPGGAPAPGRAAPGPPRSGASDVFLRAQLSASEVWVGQPITLSVLLFSTTEVQNFQWREAPTLSNFWAEDVPVDPGASRYRAEVGGRNYVVYPLQKKILMPATSGDFTLEPFAAQFQVRRSTGDAFQDFFGRRVEEAIRKTEPLRVRVRPLPERGRPPDYGGAVGSFRIRAALDRSECDVGDAIALKVTVEGDGLLKSVGPPTLSAPPDLKVFEPKVTESSDVRGEKVVSKKVWEWALVPLVPGTLRLPAPSFPYFDPAQGEYREARAAAIDIVARKGDRPSSGSATAGGAIRLERREINFIKPLRGELSNATARAHGRPWFLAALLLPLAWVPAAIAWGRRRARHRADRGAARAGKAGRRARKRLRGTERSVHRLEAQAFHEEVARALVEYVADRFDRSSAGLTYEVADGLLESRGVDPALRARFRGCLERCDFARYVPGAGSEAQRSEILREATEILERLEKGL